MDDIPEEERAVLDAYLTAKTYEQGVADGERAARERIERQVRELYTDDRTAWMIRNDCLQLIRADGTEYPALCSQPDQCRAAGRCVRSPSVCNE